jgi:hypothetical protein
VAVRAAVQHQVVRFRKSVRIAVGCTEQQEDQVTGGDRDIPDRGLVDTGQAGALDQPVISDRGVLGGIEFLHARDRDEGFVADPPPIAGE